jgi:hypothetical protein
MIQIDLNFKRKTKKKRKKSKDEKSALDELAFPSKAKSKSPTPIETVKIEQEDLEIENPQLTNLYESRMWPMISKILDNCRLSKEEEPEHYDFSRLDPPFRDINKHPLMLVARSGQETLLKHETTQKLLQLKWRYIPRFLYYSSLFIYFLYLIIFSIYSVDLSDYNKNFIPSNETIKSDSDAMPIGEDTFERMKRQLFSSAFELDSGFRDEDVSNLTHIVFYPSNKTSEVASLARAGTSSSTASTEDVSEDEFELPEDKYIPNNFGKNMFIPLLIFVLINFAQQLFKLFFISGFAFFTNFDDLLDILIGFLNIRMLFTPSYHTKSSYGSISILLSYIRFVFSLQKIPIFGIYVLAFRRTLQNSIKFFVIFLVLYVGFVMSFSMRSDFGFGFFDSVPTLIIQTLSSSMGDIKTDTVKFNHEQGAANGIIYSIFILIMSVIICNLFVGIAVGEINTVLDEAIIQQTSMRIVFVLKVQQTAKKLLKKFQCSKCANKLRSLFDIRYEVYEYEADYGFIHTFDKIVDLLTQMFSGQNIEIELVDPQKRLEETILDVGKSSSVDILNLKEALLYQISDVSTLTTHSQQKIDDCIAEMSRKTADNVEGGQDESNERMAALEDKLIKSQKQIFFHLMDFNRMATKKFESLKQSMSSLNKKSQSTLMMKQVELDKDIFNVQKNTINEFKSIHMFMQELRDHLYRIENKVDAHVKTVEIDKEQIKQQTEKLHEQSKYETESILRQELERKFSETGLNSLSNQLATSSINNNNNNNKTNEQSANVSLDGNNSSFDDFDKLKKTQFTYHSENKATE